MDVNVRAEITHGLRLRGVDVLTLWKTAHESWTIRRCLTTSLGRVLFTRDADLLVEGAARQRDGLTFGGVVYAHQLHVSIGECIEYLELIGKAGEPSERINRVEYLPLT